MKGYGAYIARRLLGIVLVMFVAITITFLLSRSLKGGPFAGERAKTPAGLAALNQQYNYDGSLISQYFRYLGVAPRNMEDGKRAYSGLLQGDFQVSTRYRDYPVAKLLADKLPRSLRLGLIAFVLAGVVGVVLGGIAAMRKGSATDYGIMLGSLFAISLPSFVTGPLLIGIFGVWLGWLPVGGWLSWKSVILPAICLSAPYAASVARLMRNSLLDVLEQEYILAGRAKGVSETALVFRHALKVAILPVVTYLGPLAAHLLTGSVVVESVFNISGAGSLFVNGIMERDGLLLSGVVIVYCVLVTALNFVVDLFYGWLDPRIRSHG